MIIRLANQTDLKAIIDMGAALQDESRAYEPLLIFDRKHAYEHYLDELNNERAHILVATEDTGKLVGYQYCFVTELDYLSNAKKECTLEAIYVLPEYRGQEIGTNLMKAAENWAINTQNVDRIKANIYNGNDSSSSMHLNNGFQPYCTEYIKRVSSSELPHA